MVLFAQDANAILAEALKNRSERELICATTKLHQRLREAEHTLTFQMLDNECPKGLQTYLKNQGIHFQMVPPHHHQANPAERAIQTFKAHFIAGLASTNPSFPLYLWDKLIPQAERTLNMMRRCTMNPRISADTFLNGVHDYNKEPMAPPGTKVLVFEIPAQRRTWEPHGQDGWYVGTAPNHYRCHTVYVPKTRATRISKTVTFFPHIGQLPNLSPEEKLQKQQQS